MTFPVPIEAARILARANIDRDYRLSDDEVARIGELIEFAERFEPQALPGMSQDVVQAGELREIHLHDETLKADEFDLIRLNDRVYAPETVEVAPDSNEYLDAQRIVESPSVIGVYAAPEWDELGDDGKAWIVALIREARTLPPSSETTVATATAMLLGGYGIGRATAEDRINRDAVTRAIFDADRATLARVIEQSPKLPGWFEAACLASMRHNANLQISPSQCDEILAALGVKSEGRKLSVSEMDPAFGADS